MSPLLPPRCSLALLLCLSVAGVSGRKLFPEDTSVTGDADTTVAIEAASVLLPSVLAEVEPTAADSAPDQPIQAQPDTPAVVVQPAPVAARELATAALLADTECSVLSRGAERVMSAASAPATTTNFDVIVIGAGLSGLKAAADLQAKGYSVAVLEGRDRLGGRVHSLKMSRTSSSSVEAGAQWLHGNKPNAVYSLVVDKLGIAPVSSGSLEALRYTSSNAFVPATTENTFWTQHDAFLTWASNRGYAKSVSIKTAMNEFTTAKALSTLKQQGLRYTVNTEIEQEFGASADSLSYRLYDEGLNTVGGDFLLPLGKSLSQIPAYLAAGVDASPKCAIRLNQDVTLVAYDTSGVTVTAVSGGVTTRYTAKAAIVTVPLGVLKKRGASFFSPALSGAKLDAVNRLGMGLLNKVILEFPSSYASKGPFQGSVDGSNVWWVVRLPLASGDSGNWLELFKVSKAPGFGNVPILITFQAGTPAVTAENSMTDAATIASVMTQLRTWYGSDMPQPVNAYVTRWWNDPWSFGSYSYQSTTCTGSERAAFSTPLKPSGTGAKARVYFAGEHTHVNYPSTMQGAFLSGQAAAAAVATAHPASQ